MESKSRWATDGSIVVLDAAYAPFIRTKVLIKDI